MFAHLWLRGAGTSGTGSALVAHGDRPARVEAADLEHRLEAADAVDELLRRDVARVEWPSIDEAVVEVALSRDGCGGVGLIEALQGRVRARLGFDLACGVASTRVVARAAARLVAHRGLLFVLPGYERRFLAPLPVGALEGLTPGMVDRLAEIGVVSVGDLAALNMAQARRALGPAAAAVVAFARGIDPRGLIGAPAPRTVWREMACRVHEPSGAARAAIVADHLEALACTVALALREGGWLARGLTLRLSTEAGTATEVRAVLRHATNLDVVFMAALAEAADALSRSVVDPSSMTLVARGLLAEPVSARRVAEPPRMRRGRAGSPPASARWGLTRAARSA